MGCFLCMKTQQGMVGCPAKHYEKCVLGSHFGRCFHFGGVKYKFLDSVRRTPISMMMYPIPKKRRHHFENLSQKNKGQTFASPCFMKIVFPSGKKNKKQT